MRFEYYSDLMFYNGSAWDRYFTSQADETITYDVLVVGSGMGGGILADATSNHGLRTLVLEAGPIRHLVNITDLPLPNLVESIDPYTVTGDELRGGVCFNLGGRSIYWSAVIPRMKQWELDFWPEDIRTFLTTRRGLTGDRRELTGYERAERLFRLRPEEAYPAYQQELLAKVAAEFAPYDVTQLPRSYHVPDSRENPRPGSPDERTTGVFSTAALLTDSVMNPGRAGNEFLDVAVQHLVDKIVFDAHGHAVGVEVLDLHDRIRRTFHARHVVLAGGTTESARLALTSGIEHPYLGVGLTDHPEAEVHFTPVDFDADSQGNLFLRSDQVPDADDGFSCELALNWQFWDVHTPDDARWRQEHRRGAPPRSTIKFLFRSPLVEANTVTVTGNTYGVHLAPPRQPSLDGPRALAERVAQFFGSTLDDELAVTPGSVTYHLAGSMRMGPSPEEGVVGTDLRFWSHDNLWCCDLSVFPDVPASNPSLTLGALAQRLAARLTDEVRASRRAVA
jgi:choline dehydrogenase-like flavoprotein